MFCLEILDKARCKHSSLLLKSVRYGGKSYITCGPVVPRPWRFFLKIKKKDFADNLGKQIFLKKNRIIFQSESNYFNQLFYPFRRRYCCRCQYFRCQLIESGFSTFFFKFKLIFWTLDHNLLRIFFIFFSTKSTIQSIKKWLWSNFERHLWR